MPSLKDSGSYRVKAPYTGTVTFDATKKIFTFGADGEADTGQILPNAPHILVETYDIDDVSGALDIHWFTKKAVDIADIDTYLAACQALIEAEVTAVRYVTYKMKATYYKGSDKADVYEADESTSFPTTANSIDVDYTPSTSTWKITDALIAPAGEVVLYEMGSTFVGGTTTPYSSGWTPNPTESWKIEIGITTHSDFTDMSGLEACGILDDGADYRISVGAYNDDAWARIGNAYYNSGTTFANSTSYALELSWDAATARMIFKVDGTTKKDSTGVTLNAPAHPLYIGGRNDIPGSEIDSDVLHYDITTFKVTEV